MAEYLNRATKEIAVCIAGCLSYADNLLDCEFKGSDKTKDALRTMKESAEKVLDGIMEGVDMDHVRAVVRYAGYSQLMVIPHTNPQAQREFYIVPDTAMEVMRRQVSGECEFCDKVGKEAKRCEIRKAMLDSLIPRKSDDPDCPYK